MRDKNRHNGVRSPSELLHKARADSHAPSRTCGTGKTARNAGERQAALEPNGPRPACYRRKKCLRLNSHVPGPEFIAQHGPVASHFSLPAGSSATQYARAVVAKQRLAREAAQNMHRAVTILYDCNLAWWYKPHNNEKEIQNRKIDKHEKLQMVNLIITRTSKGIIATKKSAPVDIHGCERWNSYVRTASPQTAGHCNGLPLECNHSVGLLSAKTACAPTQVAGVRATPL